MDQLKKLTQEKKKLDNPISRKLMKFIIKKLPTTTTKVSGPDYITGEFYQRAKEKIISTVPNLFRIYKEK